MTEDWPTAMVAIAAGVLILVFRRPYADQIIASQRWMTTRLPRWMTRNNEAMTRTMVLLIGIGFVALAVGVLLDLSPWTVMIPLFVATAIALLLTYLRAE